jgi:hypothetical protein
MQDEHKEEIESLNVDDLDVEELERRLELAAASTVAELGGASACNIVYDP